MTRRTGIGRSTLMSKPTLGGGVGPGWTGTTRGHWEADLMMFQRNRQAILMLHERHTRLLLAPVCSK